MQRWRAGYVRRSSGKSGDEESSGGELVLRAGKIKFSEAAVGRVDTSSTQVTPNSIGWQAKREARSTLICVCTYDVTSRGFRTKMSCRSLVLAVLWKIVVRWFSGKFDSSCSISFAGALRYVRTDVLVANSIFPRVCHRRDRRKHDACFPDLDNRSRLISTGEHTKVSITSDYLDGIWRKCRFRPVFFFFFFFNRQSLILNAWKLPSSLGIAGHILSNILEMIEDSLSRVNWWNFQRLYLVMHTTLRENRLFIQYINHLRWQLIADHNNSSLSFRTRLYWKVINLLFVLPGLFSNILKTERMLQFWDKKFSTCVLKKLKEPYFFFISYSK